MKHSKCRTSATKSSVVCKPALKQQNCNHFLAMAVKAEEGELATLG